jgi:hypothetical protein
MEALKKITVRGKKQPLKRVDNLIDAMTEKFVTRFRPGEAVAWIEPEKEGWDQYVLYLQREKILPRKMYEKLHDQLEGVKDSCMQLIQELDRLWAPEGEDTAWWQEEQWYDSPETGWRVALTLPARKVLGEIGQNCIGRASGSLVYHPGEFWSTYQNEEFANHRKGRDGTWELAQQRGMANGPSSDVRIPPHVLDEAEKACPPLSEKGLRALQDRESKPLYRNLRQNIGDLFNSILPWQESARFCQKLVGQKEFLCVPDEEEHRGLYQENLLFHLAGWREEVRELSSPSSDIQWMTLHGIVGGGQEGVIEEAEDVFLNTPMVKYEEQRGGNRCYKNGWSGKWVKLQHEDLTYPRSRPAHRFSISVEYSDKYWMLFDTSTPEPERAISVLEAHMDIQEALEHFQHQLEDLKRRKNDLESGVQARPLPDEDHW